MAGSKLLSAAWILILSVGLGFTVVGAIYVFFGTLMPYHERYIGLTSSDIRAFSPKLMGFIGGVIGLMGLFLISLGITNIGISLAGLRRGERWPWMIILFTNAVTVIPLTYDSYKVSGLGMPFPPLLLALIFWVTAMCFAARVYLTPK